MRTFLRNRTWMGSVATLVVIAGMVGLGQPSWATLRSIWSPPSLLDELPRSTVLRTDLQVTLRAGGSVESSKKTMLECELERLSLSAQGSRLRGEGASTIISLIPEGTRVKKGDLICELDSSEIEEFIRQQRINVERARADKLHAELTVKAAEIRLAEFLEGTRIELTQQYAGQIALLESEYQRASDRLEWTERMLEKGYVPATQVTTERLSLERTRLQLQQARLTLNTFQEYTTRLTVAQLEGEVESAEANLSAQTMRLHQVEERLAHFEDQMRKCTIRAPHDGLVIYVKARRRGGGGGQQQDVIEEGAEVRRRQQLFYLPDLEHMEVETLLHESVVDQVRPGMPARIRVEAYPNRILEGHVVAVAPLPLIDTSRNASNEVKNYIGRVQIDAVPEGLRPGMSAEVEILTQWRPDALVIPPEAVVMGDYDNQPFCYVAHHDTVQRRPVTVAQATPHWLEVLDGLEEGEVVLLDPARVGSLTEAGLLAAAMIPPF